MGEKIISGFSKLSKEEKIDWLVCTFSDQRAETKQVLSEFWQEEADLQRVLDGFSENTISN